MKRLALTLVVTIFFALTVAADDGQIPIGGKTGCNGTCPAGLASPSTPGSIPAATTDNEDMSVVDSSIFLAVLQTIPII